MSMRKILFAGMTGLWLIAAWASYHPHIIVMNVASTVGLLLSIIYLTLEWCLAGKGRTK